MTVRREAEHAPEQSEQNFWLLFAKNPQPTLVYDLETLRFLEVNEAAVRQYGYSRDEFLAMEITQIRPAEDLPAFWESFQSIQSEFQYAGQHRHRLKTGALIDVQINAHLLSFTGRAAALVVAQDITARLQAAEATRQSEARYRSLIAASPDGIVQISLDGILTVVNQQAADLYGCAAPDELLGTPLLEVISPEDRSRAQQDLRTAADVGEARNVAHTLLRRDGSTFVAELTVALMRDAQGQPEAFTAVVRDITAQVYARRTLEDLARQNAVLAAQREAIIEQIPSGLLLLDASGTVTLINEVGRRISGDPPDQARPLAEQNTDYRVRDAITNRPLAPEETPVARALQGERVENYDYIFRRSGEAEDAWARTSAAPLRGPDGHISGAVVIFSDVTQERLLLRQLARSEERLRTIYDALSCGVIVRDGTGKIVHVNHTAETVFLLSPEMVGATPYSSWQALRADGSALPREDLPSLVALRTGAAQRGQVFSFVRLDGQRLWLQGDAVPILDAEGHVAQVVESFIDITARKETEDRLRHQLAFTKAITESVGEGIYTLDRAGRLTFMNPAAERLLGWSEAALLGRDMHEAIHFQRADGTPLAAQDCPLLAVLQSGLAVSEDDDVFTRQDGTLLPVAYTSAPIHADGQVDGAVLTFHDITEQKRAEAALRKNARLQGALAQLTVLATSTLDEETMLPRICAEAAHAFALTAAAFFFLEDPQTLRLTASVRLEHLLGLRIAVTARPFAAGQAVYERRAVCEPYSPSAWPQSRGPSAATGSVLAAPIFIGEEVVGALSLFSDQPDHFDQVDLAAAAQMGDAVGRALHNARLYAREREVAAQLGQMERWRTGFLRVMAHELRTPLGHIVGFSDLLSDEAARLSERGQRNLANVQKAASRLHALVNRSLDMLRLHASEVQMEREAVVVAGLFTTAAEGQRAASAAKGVSITWVAPQQGVITWGDPQLLYQALRILLDNAVTFTPNGGHVEVSAIRHGQMVEIAVHDDGPGIAPELQEAIFSSQGEDALTRQHGGMGLSLLLARRIAELHAGSLRLEPAQQGARFVLALPAEETARTAS